MTALCMIFGHRIPDGPLPGTLRMEAHDADQLGESAKVKVSIKCERCGAMRFVGFIRGPKAEGHDRPERLASAMTDQNVRAEVQAAARRVVAAIEGDTCLLEANHDGWWEHEVRHYLAMCGEHPGYAQGSSLICDGFRYAKAALSSPQPCP